MSEMRYISTMHTFKTIPYPTTSPRIKSRLNTEKLQRDYDHLAVLFWSHCNADGSWQDRIEERLRQIERRLPPT